MNPTIFSLIRKLLNFACDINFGVRARCYKKHLTANYPTTNYTIALHFNKNRVPNVTVSCMFTFYLPIQFFFA